VHQHEAAGAIGVLDHARLEAGLAEQRRLLVTGDAGDRDRVVEEELRPGVRVHRAGVAHLRQHRARNVEQASRSSSQSSVWMLNSSVRAALL
jgi:hypothetical protein